MQQQAGGGGRWANLGGLQRVDLLLVQLRSVVDLQRQVVMRTGDMT